MEWNNTRFPTGNEDSRQTNPSGEEMAPEETQTMTPIAFLLLATTSQRIVIMRVGVERVERASLQRSLTIPEILPFSAIRFGSFFSWYVHLPPILTVEGRKKFIDKKSAQTFILTNRSRSDNLYYEEGSTPNVLIPKGMEGSVVGHFVASVIVELLVQQPDSSHAPGGRGGVRLRLR